MNINRIKRQFDSVRIIVSMLLQQLGTFMENMGHLFFHLTTYKQRPGYVEFNVDEDEADGFVRYNLADEYGKWQLYTLTFRISNRWMMRSRKHLGAEGIWHIKTAAQIEQGLTNIHSVVLGIQAHKRLEVKPFNMSGVAPPSDGYSDYKFRDFVQGLAARWFPARNELPGTTLEDVARAIIIRNP